MMPAAICGRRPLSCEIMSNVHGISGAQLPPEWMVAPHLRRSGGADSAPVAQGGNEKDRPARRARPRLPPFPDWRDHHGRPLAVLLGPPGWRAFTRS